MGEVSYFKEWQLNRIRNKLLGELCKMQEKATAETMDNLITIFEIMKPIFKDNEKGDKCDLIADSLVIITWETISYMEYMAKITGLDKEAIWQAVHELQEEEKKLLKGEQENG